MNCLQNLPRSSGFSLQSSEFHRRNNFCSVNTLRVMNAADRRRTMGIKATCGSTSCAEIGGSDADLKEEKSEVYSHNMTEAMGAVLTYRHELGMNYNFIRPDLIVGSCLQLVLQTPDGVDKLRGIGVKTIFCLQQDPDLEYPKQFCFDFIYVWVKKCAYSDLWDNCRQVYYSHENKKTGSFATTSRYFGVDIGAI